MLNDYNARMDQNPETKQKRARGRPPINAGARLSVQLAPVKVTPEHRETWRRLGGSAWLRRMLDALREST